MMGYTLFPKSSGMFIDYSVLSSPLGLSTVCTGYVGSSYDSLLPYHVYFSTLSNKHVTHWFKNIRWSEHTTFNRSLLRFVVRCTPHIAPRPPPLSIWTTVHSFLIPFSSTYWASNSFWFLSDGKNSEFVASRYHSSPLPSTPHCPKSSFHINSSVHSTTFPIGKHVNRVKILCCPILFANTLTHTYTRRNSSMRLNKNRAFMFIHIVGIRFMWCYL